MPKESERREVKELTDGWALSTSIHTGETTRGARRLQAIQPALRDSMQAYPSELLCREWRDGIGVSEGDGADFRSLRRCFPGARRGGQAPRSKKPSKRIHGMQATSL